MPRDPVSWCDTRFDLLCPALPCFALLYLALPCSPDFLQFRPVFLPLISGRYHHRPSGRCRQSLHLAHPPHVMVFGQIVDYRDTPCASSSGFPAPPLPSPSSSVLGTPFPIVPLFAYPYKLPHVSENFHIGPNSHHDPGRNTHLRTDLVHARIHFARIHMRARSLRHTHTHTLAHLHTYPYTSVPCRPVWPTYILIANMHADYHSSSLPCHHSPPFPLIISSGLRRHPISSQVFSSA